MLQELNTVGGGRNLRRDNSNQNALFVTLVGGRVNTKDHSFPAAIVVCLQ